MQTHESVRQAQGIFRPPVEQAPMVPRVTPGTPTQDADADDSHRRPARQRTRKPHSYGAGF
jgi:hypothetical protein